MNQAIDQAVLAKIKKLLALTASPNEAEAAVALSKAHEMLKAYNMSMSDITRDNPYSIIEETYMEGFRERPWRTMLISEVCAANYCTSAKVTRGASFTIKLFGKEHNVAGARVMIDYLLEVLERQSKKVPARDRDSYKMGMVCTFRNRLVEMMKKDEVECRALVVRERETVNKHLADEGFTTKSVSLDVKKPSAFNKGFLDAKDISLNQQVGGNNRQAAYIR